MSPAGSEQNVARGVRPDLPPRPALEEDAWERIRHEQQKGRERECVRFAFFRLDPAWRALPADQRDAHKAEVEAVVADFGRSMMLYAYSTVATRADCDFMLWQAARDIDRLHTFAAALHRTALGPYLRLAHSYFALTRRSIYLNRYEQEYLDRYGGSEKLDQARIAINPQGSKFLFVYPFVKTREWYTLPHAARQKMMDEHIRIGHEWPDVKLNTTYSYGLDDQEFVVAFETDYISRFLDLLMALRLSEASAYTLRDTPSFTCIAMSLRDCLDALG
ncbi:MAG: chlorite dismutase family protein [Longimicrobiales bacterium]